MIFVHFYRQQEEEANIEELQGSIALQNEAINALEQVRNNSIFQQTNPYLQIVIKLSPNTTFLKWYKGLANTEEEIYELFKYGQTCVQWSYSLTHNFPFFFAIELGHFIVDTQFIICYKHSKIGKREKNKGCKIDSWSQPYQTFIFPVFRFSLVSLSVCYIWKKTHQQKNDLAYQQKTEKFFVYVEKRFGRIDSRIKLDPFSFRSQVSTRTWRNRWQLSWIIWNKWTSWWTKKNWGINSINLQLKI